MGRQQLEGIQLKREALLAAIDEALRGTPRPLYNYLARHSSLPSPRPNQSLLTDFADICGSRGAKIDALIIAMSTIDADYAQGGTEFEFVPMCGVAALGARAAAGDKAYRKLMETLHATAEDLRFKVRDAVPIALTRIGAARGDALITDVAPWMDGMFHAAAVLRALAEKEWLTTLQNGDEVIARLDEAFALLDGATRSAQRYPGYKALVDAISVTPGVVATRFGVPVFDAIVRWSKTKEPVLREAIEKNLTGTRLAGRHLADIARVRKALNASQMVRRDDDRRVAGTRGRGKPKI